MNNRSEFFKNLGGRIGSVMKKNVPFLILLFLLILFSFVAPNFMTFGNLRTLIRQVSFSGISAVGLMFVMISGGIDLSIGSQIVFSNVLLAIMMADWKLPPSLAIPLILLVGTGLGAINGFLCITLKIHPLIITLGTSAIFKGFGYIINQVQEYHGVPRFLPLVWSGICLGNPRACHCHGCCGVDRVFHPDQDLLWTKGICIGW